MTAGALNWTTSKHRKEVKGHFLLAYLSHQKVKSSTDVPLPVVSPSGSHTCQGGQKNVYLAYSASTGQVWSSDKEKRESGLLGG